MRKILSGLMVLTLVVLFAATYYCSQLTEDIFKSQIEKINLTYAGILQVELLDYQRGLLVSDAKTTVSLRDKESLSLNHQIRHFPWKIRMQTGLMEGSGLALEIAQLLPLDKLQLQTDVVLDGSSQTRFDLPEFHFEDDKGLLKLQGLKFNCDLEQQMQGGQIQFQLQALTVNQPGEAELVLSGVQLDSQFAEQQQLLLGGGSFAMQSLSIQPENKPGFEINGLRYEASNLLENDQLSSVLALTIADLQLVGETFTDGQLRLKVSGVSAATLREMQETAKQMQAEMLGQQVDPMIMQLQLLGLYSQLFKEGLTLDLEQLSLQTDEGGMQGKGQFILYDLNLTGGASLALENLNGAFELDIDRPAFIAGFRLLDTLQRKGAKSNPAVIAEQAEQLAGGLVQKGFFARRDGGYRIDMAIEQGQGTLNGNPFRF